MVFHVKFGGTSNYLNFKQRHYITQETEGQELKILVDKTGDTNIQTFFTCEVCILFCIPFTQRYDIFFIKLVKQFV